MVRVLHAGRLLAALAPELEQRLRAAFPAARGTLRLETDAGVAQALLEIEVFGLGLDYLLRYPGLIRSVTPEAIGAAASRYWDLGGYTVAMAVPA